jgi:acyl carrier protein
MDENEIKLKLKTFICTEIMNDPDYPLKYDEPLITSGLIDSFSLAQIGVFVEIEFKTYVPDPELTVDKMNTIDAMTAKIMEKMA